MSVAVCRSDAVAASTAESLAGLRADGGIDILFKVQAHAPDKTVAKSYHEYGGYRVRIPRSYDGAEAVIINTAGGMASGDRANYAVQVGDGASATVTTQAAERIYRSLGPETRIATQLTANAQSMLCWLPQESILFSDAHLARKIDADVHATGRLLIAECFTFGRTAMGEKVTAGCFNDQWRIKRAGKLIYADAVNIHGSINEILAHPAVAAGYNSVATVLYVAPDAEDRLNGVRQVLAGAQTQAAASAWDGILSVRLLGHGTAPLRRDLAGVSEYLSSRPMPRVWWT
ncbi:MAG: urease accessory protein UreD [Hyphomicrobiaceae bacterium]